jgi:endo-1,4-beta-xylanase
MASVRRSLEVFGFVSACLGVAAVFGGCASEETPGGEAGAGGTGTGGVSGRGGSGPAGSGALAGAGGASGAAASGSAGAGGSGSAGKAGAPNLGGASGTGGSNSSGSAGAAGAAGTGGAGGTAGNAGSGSGGSAGTTAGAGGASGGAAGSGGASGGAGGNPNTCPPESPKTGGTRYCSNSRGNIAGGYSYELWAEGGGMGCMNVYGADATFSATWSDVEDFLARVGLDFDRTRTPAEVGNITAQFAHTKTGSEEGLTYIGIYGWTVNPLREYYILDDWGTTKPAGVASDGTPRTSVGTLTADGETYDVWMKTRVNKPAITGDNMTFDQYFSIRRTARQCGTISVSEHFEKWVEMGLELGDLVEVKLLLEAQFNTGGAEFTTAKILVD